MWSSLLLVIAAKAGIQVFGLLLRCVRFLARASGDGIGSTSASHPCGDDALTPKRTRGRLTSRATPGGTDPRAAGFAMK